MTLKAVLDSLDDVPEAFHGEYVEKDGKFYLDLDDTVRQHSLVTPLSNALNRAKTERAALQTKLAEATAKLEGLPEDFDPATYAEIKAEYDKLVADPAYKGAGDQAGQRMKEQYEQRIASLTAAHEKKLKDKEDEIAQRDAELGDILVGDGLTQALVAAGVRKELLPAAKALLKGDVKVELDETSGKRRAVVETDLGEQSIRDFVENWAKSDDGKAFVVPPTGSGAPGAGGDRRQTGETNPWAEGSVNLTQQGAILRQDRAKAIRLMRAAKVPEAKITSLTASQAA